jgi:hypothetical protein
VPNSKGIFLSLSNPSGLVDGKDFGFLINLEKGVIN